MFNIIIYDVQNEQCEYEFDEQYNIFSLLHVQEDFVFTIHLMTVNFFGPILE